MKRLWAGPMLLALVAALVGAGSAAGAASDSGIRFSSGVYRVSEDRPSVTIRVEREAALSVGRSTVDYSTEDGTALNGRDYQRASGTLSFEIGETSKTFSVLIVNDDLSEPTEHLTLTLVDHQGAGAGSPASLVLADDDVASPAVSVVPPSGPVSEPSSGRGAPGVGADTAVTAHEAGPRSTIAGPRPLSPVRRRVTLHRAPSTPFELGQPRAGRAPGPDQDRAVEPLLAVLAGLALARVGAEVWFRSRRLAEGAGLPSASRPEEPD